MKTISFFTLCSVWLCQSPKNDEDDVYDQSKETFSDEMSRLFAQPIQSVLPQIPGKEIIYKHPSDILMELFAHSDVESMSRFIINPFHIYLLETPERIKFFNEAKSWSQEPLNPEKASFVLRLMNVYFRIIKVIRKRQQAPTSVLAEVFDSNMNQLNDRYVFRGLWLEENEEPAKQTSNIQSFSTWPGGAQYVLHHFSSGGTDLTRSMKQPTKVVLIGRFTNEFQPIQSCGVAVGHAHIEREVVLPPFTTYIFYDQQLVLNFVEEDEQYADGSTKSFEKWLQTNDPEISPEDCEFILSKFAERRLIPSSKECPDFKSRENVVRHHRFIYVTAVQSHLNFDAEIIPGVPELEMNHDEAAESIAKIPELGSDYDHKFILDEMD